MWNRLPGAPRIQERLPECQIDLRARAVHRERLLEGRDGTVRLPLFTICTTRPCVQEGRIGLRGRETCDGCLCLGERSAIDQCHCQRGTFLGTAVIESRVIVGQHGEPATSTAPGTRARISRLRQHSIARSIAAPAPIVSGTSSGIRYREETKNATTVSVYAGTKAAHNQ